MTGNVVSKYSPPTESIVNEIANNSSLNTDYYTPIQVATAVAFLVGIYQVIWSTMQHIQMIRSILAISLYPQYLWVKDISAKWGTWEKVRKLPHSHKDTDKTKVSTYLNV